jgi:hypothetical protein
MTLQWSASTKKNEDLMDSERDEISIFNFIRMLMTNDFQKQVNEIQKYE